MPKVDSKNWYVLYTKPRWEKKVEKLLQQANYHVFLPVKKTLKQYTDRKKEVEEIVLPSYIFVELAESQKTEIRYVDGVVNFVYWQKKAAIVSSKEIEKFKKYLSNFYDVLVENDTLQEGQTILLQQAAFKNQKALVQKIVKNKIYLFLPQLQLKITVNKNSIQTEK